jgi:hypothetical protein
MVEIFHVLRLSDLSVLGTSVIHGCYLFHIHTAVLSIVILCTDVVISLSAIVSVVTYQGTALLLFLFLYWASSSTTVAISGI